MTRKPIAIVFWLVASAAAQAAEPYRIANIRVEGLVRISEGTLFNYLPIQPGDVVDDSKLAGALRSVYRSGFYNDVEFRRDGDDLVIMVDERPAIESFSIDGNKEIKTEDLERVLVGEGLAEGRIFNRSTLDQVTQELVRQYHSRGRYGVEVASDVTDVGQNQVRVAIRIKEGEISGIRQINIVGNTAFPDDKLLEQLELSTGGMFSFISEDDRYAREKLGSDLEKLRSYYMDRGYADFKIESTQVSVSPDRRGVFVSINIREGDVYTIRDAKIVGELPLPEGELLPYQLVKAGNRFSMATINTTAELFKQRLGVDGFAFAEATPYPEIDREKKEVGITFLIEAGSRAYVRRINFKSTGLTDDTVFRREMRQLESTWLTNSQVERSRLRIARLPFVEDVTHEVERVPGTDDQVDVLFDVKERQAGTFNAAIGFGGTTTGAFLDFSITHSNFLGTGDRVQVGLNSRSYAQAYNFSVTEPYWTIDGVTRTLSLYYNTADSFGTDLETLSRENFGGTAAFRWPISEFSYLSFGISATKTDLAVSALTSSPSVYAFVTNPNHGDPYTLNLGFGNVTAGLRYKTLALSAGWSHDTRNRAIFADRGTHRQLVADVAVYPGDVQWWSLKGTQTSYIGLWRGYTYGVDAEVAVVHEYDTSADVPPDRKLFGGGADSVRGFRDAYLSPGYTNLNGRFVPTGGNMRFSVQNELLLPNFFADDPFAPPKNGRVGLFVDVGMVFPSIEEFRVDELRASAGVSATFLTPIGAMRFSFAYPLRSEDTDETERFQFTIGTLF